MLDPDFNNAAYCAESDECELILSFCQLIDIMVKDLQHLEAECVRTRYHLSKHMRSPEDYRQGAKFMDMFKVQIVHVSIHINTTPGQ